MMTRIYSFAIKCLIFTVFISSCTWEQLSPKFDCSISPVSIQVIDTQPTECNIASGSIAVIASGGAETFQYILGTKSNSDGIFEELDAGLYNVLAIDVNGCSKEVPVTVGNINDVNLEGVQVSNAGCGTQNGEIEVTASGGLPPYEFKLNTGVAQSANTFENLAKGNYTITVSDQNGCETTSNATVLSGVSYESSVKNIISINCAISGCHNGSVSPDLRSFNNIQSRADEIKSRTASGNMPKNRSLTQTQKSLIACWVDDGALQN